MQMCLSEPESFTVVKNYSWHWQAKLTVFDLMDLTG